jgi:ribosomal protein S12 methylthiotransferase accessory factor
MKRQPVQREFTLDHALVSANDCLLNLNMNMHFQIVGSAGKLYTYLCLINNHNIQLTFRGAGSGLSQEAKVKAVYEAMEDSLVYQTLGQINNQHIKMFSTLTSPSTDFLDQNELLPEILKSSDFLLNSYPWLKLQNLNSINDSIYYPLGLLFPHASHFEYYNKYINQAAISHIANSTGIAMGASEVEALIHGINDWIERDAYGLFLLNTIIKKVKPARRVVKNTLPDNLQKHIQVIENINNDELVIIDMTSDLDIPSFLVSFTKQPVPVQPSGLGASLCKIDALQQALFEALQSRDRYNDNTIISRHKTIQHYQTYPILLQAFKIDLLQLINEGCFIDIHWHESVTQKTDPDLANQLKLIIKMITARRMNIFYNVLFKDVNGVALVYVLLAGAETFGMMREGLFIPIKKRGLEQLT